MIGVDRPLESDTRLETGRLQWYAEVRREMFPSRPWTLAAGHAGWRHRAGTTRARIRSNPWAIEVMGRPLIESSRVRLALETSQQRAGLPVLPPLAAFIELVVLVAAILGIDWLVTGFSVSDFQPNPFWIPVLLLSLHYGTVSGLIAAATVIALTMLQGVPEQAIGENHFAYLLRIWAEPILWISVALLLGQFRMRQISNKLELRRKVEELSSQRAAIADYANNLRARCGTLERELAARSEVTSLKLLAFLAAVREGGEGFDGALGKLVSAAFPGADASLYLLHGDALLRRSLPDGATEGRVTLDRIPSDHPLFAAVVGQRASLSVLRRQDETALAGLGLAAAPVRAPDGQVIGVLILDRASALAMGDDTGAALSAIGDVVGLSLVARPSASEHGREQEDGSLRARFGSRVRLLTHPGLSEPGTGSGGPGTSPSRPRLVR